MAIRFIELEVPKSDGELPWFKDYMASNPIDDDCFFTVNLISFGVKGVLFTTEYFKCFLYKSNPFYGYLLQAANHWVSSKQPVCPLIVYPDKSVKEGYRLGIEEDLECSWEKKTDTTFVVSTGTHASLSIPPGSNPLLATPSKSRTPKEVTKVERKGGRKQRADVVGKATDSLLDAFEDSEELDVPPGIM